MQLVQGRECPVCTYIRRRSPNRLTFGVVEIAADQVADETDSQTDKTERHAIAQVLVQAVLQPATLVQPEVVTLQKRTFVACKGRTKPAGSVKRRFRFRTPLNGGTIK